MAMEYWCFYHSYEKKLARLSDEQFGRLIRALTRYSISGEAQQPDDDVAMAYDFITDEIDRTKANYAERCRKNRENGSRRAKPSGESSAVCDDVERSLPNAPVCSQSKSKGKGKSKGESESKSKRESESESKSSIPSLRDVAADVVGAAAPASASAAPEREFTFPDVDEVAEYCRARGNGIDAQRFVDFYAAQGWMLSNGFPMRDWRAVVRNWETRDRMNGGQPGARQAHYRPSKHCDGMLRGSLDIAELERVLDAEWDGYDSPDSLSDQWAAV